MPLIEEKKHGDITDIEGVFASGINSGIKETKKDLAFIYVPQACASAGVFSKNKVLSSTVAITKNNMKQATLKALIINSGNANSCTGKEGEKNAQEMVKRTAHLLNLDECEVGVASTGIIGKQLPMDKVVRGIEQLLRNKQAREGKLAAEAILTTDTYVKNVFMQAKIGNKEIYVAGFTKGSGMIAPNMATTLGFLVTNVVLDSKDLQAMLSEAIQDTYNMISVDTDLSTNDTIVMLATKTKKSVVLDTEEEKGLFKKILKQALMKLALMIIKDGEGASKIMQVEVRNAASKDDARKIAKSVIDSPLVKSALYAISLKTQQKTAKAKQVLLKELDKVELLLFGRIMMAIGKQSECVIDSQKLRILMDKSIVIKDGCIKEYDKEHVMDLFFEEMISITIDVQSGKEEATAWGCDLTHAYVDINIAYT
jgi:glutamate N-acetyltransferase/amino-acid N-acetyltransferase